MFHVTFLAFAFLLPIFLLLLLLVVLFLLGVFVALAGRAKLLIKLIEGPLQIRFDLVL